MASTTSKRGLNKPARTDYVNVITDLNDNMDNLDNAVPDTRKVNGHALSSDVTVSKDDVGLGNVDNVQQVPATRKVNNKALSSDVTLYGSDIPMNSLDGTKLDAAISDTKSALETEIDLETTNRIQAVATERTRATSAETLLQSNISNEVNRATTAEAEKVNKPTTSPNGTNGQFLRTNGDGSTTWDDPAVPTSEQIEAAVDNWLDGHPEAVTTVQDGSITPQKLNTVLLKSYKKSGTAMVYFPSLETGGYSGSSALMVFDDGNAVLFDANATVNKTAVMDYYQELYDAGLFSNISVIIISHFHWDHVQNLEDIIESFPHVGCHAYIPMNPDGYYTESDASTILTNRTSVIETLTIAGIPYTEVDEDTVVEAKDGFCMIELFNSNQTAYTHYASNTTYYNDYSMVALVKTGDIYSMFPGDIQRAAQDYLMDTYDLPRLFLYAVHHHGIQNDDNVLYLDKINPEWGVIQTNHTRGLESAASSFTSNYAVRHLCSSAYDSHVFAIGKNGGYIVNGEELERSGWYYSYVYLYVDSEYSGTIHDGTAEHPFTQIGEAVMHVKENRNVHYFIYVLARSTAYGMIWLRDINVALDFIGVATTGISKPTVNCAYVRNCSAIYFEKFVFKGTYQNSTSGNYSTIYSSEATIRMAQCEIDSEWNSEMATERFGYEGRMSDLYIANSVIKNTSKAFRSYQFTNVKTNALTFTDVNICYYLCNIDLIIRGLDTVSGISYYMVQIDSSVNGMMPIVTMPSNKSLSAIKELCSYNTLKVCSLPFVAEDNGTFDIYYVHAKNVYKYTGVAETDLVTGIERITDLNDAKNPGFYTFANTASHRPTTIGTSGGSLLVMKYSDTYMTQIVTFNTYAEYKMAMRKWNGSSWSTWYQMEFTAPQS